MGACCRFLGPAGRQGWWAAKLKEWGWSEGEIQEIMEERKRAGNCLFVFALVQGVAEGHPKVKVLSKTNPVSD